MENESNDARFARGLIFAEMPHRDLSIVASCLEEEVATLTAERDALRTQLGTARKLNAVLSKARDAAARARFERDEALQALGVARVASAAAGVAP